MGIKVISPGLFTTVQDQGRHGYQRLGFSVSGAMDQRAFRLANLLVDNPPDEAVLELTATGPVLEFTRRCIIAITGGDFQPTVNGRPIPCCSALLLRRGDQLAFGPAKTGFRAYLAFAGGLDIPPLLGSRSTHTKCAWGGLKGRALRAGDQIRLRAPRDRLPHFGSRSLAEEVFRPKAAPLRVIPGPQADYFTAAGLAAFYHSTYTVTAEFDRMGARLSGPAIELAKGADIISDGIAFGAIQIPSHGNPIIMLADRQTTGGYPKIGTVASVDLPRLVQSRPGESVRFAAITVEEAQQLLAEEEKQLAMLTKKINTPHQRVVAYTIEPL